MRGVLKPAAERIANDAYFTPRGLAAAICQRLHDDLQFVPSDVLEPNAGGGAFVDAARTEWPSAHVHGEDVAGEWPQPGSISRAFELAIGNPPFSIAEEQVRSTAARLCDGGYLAFILRLSFLGGQKRAALYEAHPLRYLIPITPRPSFTPDGKTDASEYAVFVWQRGYADHAEILPHLRWQR